MSVLPADINQNLTELLSNLASSDNSSRSIAEKILEEQWSDTQKVEILLTFLSEQACLGSTDMLRSFSAVLFRRIAIKQPNTAKFTDRNIEVIREEARYQIRSTLLNGFLKEESNPVRHKLSDCIAEVAKVYTKPDNQWQELLPALFEAAKNSNPSICESAFRIFASAPEIIGQQYLNDILPVFNHAFTNDNDDVRIASCTAFVEFFKNLPKNVWGNLSPLLPNLLNSLPMFLQNGQDVSLALVLGNLIDLVTVAPKMFKDMFPQIIEFGSMVAKDKELDGGTRSSALELLTCFAESSPNMCKRSESYSNSMVLVTLSMLTEVCIDDDEASEWNNNTNDDEEDEEIEYDAARQSLDRVCLSLGGNSLAGPLFQYLPQMIQSPNWRERQAALMALSSAAEGCVDVLINEIPKLLQLILPLINDDHPRVQYACCNALGQMSTDFADVIQRNNGDQVLPALISRLTNNSVPRVQAHAAAALVNFSENSTKEVIEPYLDDLLTNLLGLLHSPKRYVQEQVLTTIAAIADAAEKKFVKYYETLMPLLINVLSTDIDEHNKALLARTIECSSLIALAVGKEMFQNNGQQQIIQLFGNLQANLKDDDDEIRQQLDQAWARVCKLMGRDFLPYLPEILPSLMTTAKASQDINVLDEEEAEEYEASDEWEVIEISGRHVAVHTAALDEKGYAMEILNSYAMELKGDFLPWTQQLASIALPALDFYLHDGVRASAAVALSSTLRCVVLATGANSNEALQLWSQICEKLCKTLTNEPVPELLVAYYSCLRICIELLNSGALSSVQLGYLNDSIFSNLNEVYERVKDKDNEDDEYTEDVDDEEQEYTDEEILDKINSVIEVIFKKSGNDYLQQFSRLYPVILSLVKEENSNLRTCGLLTIIHLLQYCGESSGNFEEIIPILSETLQSSDVSVKQYSATAIGYAALTGLDRYKEFCISCLQPMFSMISVPDAKADENIYATESMIASISQILSRFSGDIGNLDQYLNKWFEFLPVVHSETSSKFVVQFVIQLIKGQHPIIENNLMKTIDYLLSPISHGVLFGSDLTSTVEISRQLLSSLPQEKAIEILSKYKGSSIVQKYFS